MFILKTMENVIFPFIENYLFVHKKNQKYVTEFKEKESYKGKNVFLTLSGSFTGVMN